MSLRDRLAQRQLARQTVRLPADPAGYAAAAEELAAALLAARQRPLRGIAAEEAHARVLAAQQALDEHPGLVVTLKALPPDEWEALVALHPPTEEQAARGWQWNAETLRPELLAVAVAPPDGEEPPTADDWRAYARDGSISAGEQDLLLTTAVTLNTRVISVTAGKG